jgi:hypothetical protein
MVCSTTYSTISLGGAFGLSSVRSAPTVMIALAFCHLDAHPRQIHARLDQSLEALSVMAITASLSGRKPQREWLCEGFRARPPN